MGCGGQKGSVVMQQLPFIADFITSPSLTYIRWITVFFLLPQIVFLITQHKIIKKHWRIFPPVIIVTLSVGLPWDYFGIKDGSWYFPNTLGILILDIPLEEYLFLIFIAILGTFTTLFFYRKASQKHAG